MKHLFFLCLFMGSQYFYCQSFDAEKYTYTIMLNEKSDEIKVHALLDFKKLSKEKELLKLNLTQYTQESSKGMKITELYLGGIKTDNFRHYQDTISIPVASDMDKFSVSIVYQGVPKDGLIISTLANQEKTYFSDHWPNRARNWLACIDSPSDKAKVHFKVYSPKDYEVVANGLLNRRQNFDEFNYFDWETNYEIPTKVMAIGVAKFQSSVYQKKPITISGYTFNGDSHHYQEAVEILKWFEHKIDAYPFQKLANVQSKTRYGGMENAGCIFYNEKSVLTNSTPLIAHEIAHQWFGNTVTETDFTHLWLSEGFATFLENQYIKETQGDIAYEKRMKEAQKNIIQFHQRFPKFVMVPSHIEDPNLMLNPYSYQKGAWFLHTLQKEIGNDLFWKTIKTFYRKFKFKNANSTDFKNIVEKESKKDLNALFDLWLYKSDLPPFEL
ncbi:MAG: M1 family metallopeptidase [Flavobacteriales bacterium]